jgi:hypothetical protein
VLSGASGALPILTNAVSARAEVARALRVARTLGASAVTLAGLRPDAKRVAASILARVDEVVDRGIG